MSYGLNIEMHKQVGAALFPIGHLGGWVGRWVGWGGFPPMRLLLQTRGRTCVIAPLCLQSCAKLRFVSGV